MLDERRINQSLDAQMTEARYYVQNLQRVRKGLDYQG